MKNSKNVLLWLNEYIELYTHRGSNTWLRSVANRTIKWKTLKMYLNVTWKEDNTQILQN